MGDPPESYIKQQQQNFSSTESVEPNFNEEAPPIPSHLMNIYHLNEKEKKNERVWNHENNKEFGFEEMDIEESDILKKIKFHIL